MKTWVDNIEYAVRNWWISLIIGLLFLLVGIGVMFTPLTSYVTLSILFSVSLIIGGLFELFFAINNKNTISGWGWYLAGGIIDLIIGIYLIANPAVGLAVLPYVLAFWLIFRGVSIIGAAMDLRKYQMKGWGWSLFFGILAILCAIWIFWNPAVGALSIVYLVSFILIFTGIFRIMLAFELKKIKKHYTELKHA